MELSIMFDLGFLMLIGDTDKFDIDILNKSKKKYCSQVS